MSGLMQFFRKQSKAIRTALVVMAFLSGVALAQSEVGRISGRVTDPNGAVIPGATIQAKLLDTEIKREATANGEGFYLIESLPPGIYEVTVQGQGFATKTQKVRVFVGSYVRYDPQLSVTPVTGEETVVEGSGGVDVNTSTPQLSDPISNRQLNELPTITRDPYSLITLSGNVTANRVGALNPINDSTVVTATTAPFQDFSINGQIPTGNNVRLDGGENIVNYWSTLGHRIPLAGVQEINVITNGFRPQYGRLLGGMVDVATRQGSNDWNGQAYYFYRGDALATNTFDSNARGIEKGHLVGNQPGFALGGPIARDKLFFFVSGEGIINRSRIDRVALVPTPALLAASDPATAAFFAPFPLTTPINGSILTVADTLALIGTPVTAGAFSALPPGLPAFGEVFINTQNDWGAGPPQDTALAVGRIDYALSDRSLIYGRYAYVYNDIYNGSLSYSPFAGFNTGIRNLTHNAAINWLQSLGSTGCCPTPGSSNWVMNLKGQFERVNLTRQTDFPIFTPGLFLAGYPNTSFGGVRTAFPGELPFNQPLDSLLTGPLNLGQVALDFIGALGASHQVRFGGSYYYFQDNRSIRSFQNGQYTLQGGAPLALSNLVLGTANTFTTAINPFGALPGDIVPLPVTAPDFSRSISAHDFSLYFSDIWRAHPRLSVTLGLRYDFFDTPRSRNDQIFLNYYLGPGPDVFTQVATGALLPPNNALAPDDPFFKRDWNNFGPRIGVAWDIHGNGRTTLRGGYGITYERLFYAVSPFFQTRPDFGIYSLTAGTPGIGPIPLSTSPFGPLGGLTGTAVLPPQLVRGIELDISTPMVHFFNASLAHEFLPNTIGAVHYAGAAGRDLFTLYNANLPGSAAAYLGSPSPTARLNPLFGPIYFLTSDGKSNYNAVIGEVTNSSWRSIGLSLTARYRYAKALDNVSSIFGNNMGTFVGGSFAPDLLSPFDPAFNYGPADFDVRHRFIGSFNWEVPFDWLTGGWGEQIFGGWQVAGIGVFQSGLPYTVFDCGATLTAETPCPRARLAPGVDIGDLVNRAGGDAIPSAVIPNYFNYLGSGAFTFAAPGTALPPFSADTPGRNLFRGPRFWTFDLGVYKRFRISEDVSVQFRSEFYNIFNNANMFVPNGVDISSNPFVPSFKNGARFIQFGAKFLF